MVTNKFFDSKIIVGLGNPGPKYENTLHNIGFILLDTFFVPEGISWREERDFKSLICAAGTALLVKPLTFMNNSGTAVAKILNFYKKSSKDLIVIHDDVDLEFGKIRTVTNRGSAGHHGVEDIAEKIGTLDFCRIRIGVGRPNDARFDVEDYVLTKLPNDKLELLKQSFEKFLKTV